MSQPPTSSAWSVWKPVARLPYLAIAVIFTPVLLVVGVPGVLAGLFAAVLVALVFLYPHPKISVASGVIRSNCVFPSVECPVRDVEHICLDSREARSGDQSRVLTQIVLATRRAQVILVEHSDYLLLRGIAEALAKATRIGFKDTWGDQESYFTSFTLDPHELDLPFGVRLLSPEVNRSNRVETLLSLPEREVKGLYRNTRNDNTSSLVWSLVTKKQAQEIAVIAFVVAAVILANGAGELRNASSGQIAVGVGAVLFGLLGLAALVFRGSGRVRLDVGPDSVRKSVEFLGRTWKVETIPLAELEDVRSSPLGDLLLVSNKRVIVIRGRHREARWGQQIHRSIVRGAVEHARKMQASADSGTKGPPAGSESLREDQ